MQARSLILMGRSGNGKSSTGNSIVGRKVFKTGFSLTSGTKDCQMEQTKWKDGRIINLIDTPGLFNVNSANSKEYIQSQIAKCMELAKGGVHGVLYVVSIKNRFTAEEGGVLDSLQMLFGPEIINYVVLVFTGGDELESEGMTLEDYLKDCTPQLEEVLKRCNMRKVLFDNKTISQAKKDRQTTELMKQIDSIIAKNGGQPYSNEFLRQAQENLEKFLRRQTCRAESGRTCDGELASINAEQMEAINAMVGEKTQAIIKMYDEKLANERAARKEAEKIAKEALQVSKELRKAIPTCEKSPLQEFCDKACEMLSGTGCTIL